MLVNILLASGSASKQDRVEIYAIQATNKTDVANMQLDKTAMYNADAEQVRNLTRKEGSLGDHLKYNRYEVNEPCIRKFE